MGYDLENLPENLEDCHAIIGELASEVETNRTFIQKLQYQIEQLLRHRYGQRADRINPDQLVFEAMKELMDAGESPAEEKRQEPSGVKAKKKPARGHGRGLLPKHLPREQVIHDVPEEQKVCTSCGRDKPRIGEEVTERLDYRPATLVVIQDICPKYACKDCPSSVVAGDKPMLPIEKGLAGPGLLAHVITSKYADHLPLHRLEGIFKRHGVHLSRKTMSGWMGASSELLDPLYQLMKDGVLQSKVVHTDDTPVPVQDRKKTKTHKGIIWVYLGDAAHPYVVYDYTPTRARDGPERFLGDFKGYLQADAYTGYDQLYADGNVVEVACMAHARRKFVDAQSSDLSRAVIATAYIKMLYRIEEKARSLSPAKRRDLRQGEAKPILERFEKWLLAEKAQVLGKSPIGKAINYALNNWTALNRYIEDGDLSIDNNAAERALRSVAIGRNNWQFFGSNKGGRTAAVLFSFVMTCKALDIDPFHYLKDVIDRISAHPARRLEELLPDRWKELREQAEEQNEPPSRED
jgi:transposase